METNANYWDLVIPTNNRDSVQWVVSHYRDSKVVMHMSVALASMWFDDKLCKYLLVLVIVFDLLSLWCCCKHNTLEMAEEDEGIYHDEVEIEDFEYDPETETFTYPCPCGDLFSITKVINSFLFIL